MTVMFSKLGPLDTTKEAYTDGFKTGQTWNAYWTPGGPWVCRAGSSRDQDWLNYCAQTELNNAEWLRGWRDGVASQAKASQTENRSAS